MDENARRRSVITVLPGSGAVGRAYALYDAAEGREVLGTVIAYRMAGAPTWQIRLHAPSPTGDPVFVWVDRDATSHLGRWQVTHEVALPKADRYAALVRARKAWVPPHDVALTNPAAVDGGIHDSGEIGPWTRWAGDLNAAIMVVGQDWGDVSYFRARRGIDAPSNPTNIALRRLLASIGYQLPEPPAPDKVGDPELPRRATGVYLTNALLWLKNGGLSAPVRPEWFQEAAGYFLLEQVAIVQPRVIVALGERAYRAIRRAYGLPTRSQSSFGTVVAHDAGTPLTEVPGSPVLFAAYHCGRRVQNQYRPLQEQMKDWQRIVRVLQRSAAGE